MFLKDRKGIMLITCYLVIVVLTILGSAFLVRSVSEKRIAERERDSIQALWLAEAGIDKAIWYLTNTAPNGSTDGTWRTTAYPATPGLSPTDPQQESLGSGNYTIWVENGPVDIANTIKVTSEGAVGTAQRTLEEIIRMTGGGGLSGFNFAVLAGGNLHLEGNGSIQNQDVYVNGNLEVRSPNGINGGDVYAKGNTTLRDGGNVTGNVNANGNITVNSGSIITGDATSAGTVNNNGIITGTSTSGAVPDPVDEAALQALLDSYRVSEGDWDNYKTAAQEEGNYYAGNLSLSGDYSGTYYVDGNVTIDADVSGAATFVIDGNVKFKSGNVSLDSAPGDDYAFIIKKNVESTDDASGSLGGVIYTEGNFKVSSGIALDGAVICFGNLHISGDFNIGFPVGGGTLEILSWREL